MSDFKETQHGRNHSKKGSDPIGTFIEYDVENVGDWLDISVTGTSPFSGVGFYVDVRGNNLTLDNTGALTFNTGGGGWTVDTDGAGLVWTFGGGGWDLDTDGGGLNWDLHAGGFSLSASGGVNWDVNYYGWQLRAGGTFEVLDHLGAPIFRVAENGDLHGKTGKALTFDL